VQPRVSTRQTAPAPSSAPVEPFALQEAAVLTVPVERTFSIAATRVSMTIGFVR